VGNHCIDCEFCGQDQRLVGPECCEQQREKRREEEFDRLHAVEIDAAYLKPYGLIPHTDALGYRTKLDAKDVVGVLKKIRAGIL
jgi:hypothetical protein